MNRGYTVEEAARVLGLPTERVWDLVARGVFSGARGEDGTWRVNLGGTPSESIDPQPSSAGASGDPLPVTDAPAPTPAGAELSPFRELLTEFRHLTERYGQALLALGEARGEVASLTSRVDALETRIDLRLPYAGTPVSAASIPVPLVEADAVDAEGAAEIEPAETDALEFEAGEMGDEPIVAATSEEAAPDDATDEEPGIEETVEEPRFDAEPATEDAAREEQAPYDSAPAEPGAEIVAEAPAEPEAAHLAEDDIEVSSVSAERQAPQQQESEEVAAAADAVEDAAASGEGALTAELHADDAEGVEPATETPIAADELGPELPEGDLPQGDLPSSDEEFETIDDLLVLAADEVPPAEAPPPEAPMVEAPHDDVAETRAFTVDEEQDRTQRRRNNRLSDEIAAALARADDPSPPELPNGTDQSAASTAHTESFPAVTAPTEPPTNAPFRQWPPFARRTEAGEEPLLWLGDQPEDETDYAAEMEVGSAGWQTDASAAPARSEPAAQVATEDLGADPYPDQSELINALGWEQDEVEAIRSMLAGHAASSRESWSGTDPDARQATAGTVATIDDVAPRAEAEAEAEALDDADATRASAPAPEWPAADQPPDAAEPPSPRREVGRFELPGAVDLDTALAALRRRSSEEAAAEETADASSEVAEGAAVEDESAGPPVDIRMGMRSPSGLDDPAWSRRSPAANAYRRLRRFLGG